MKTVKIGKHLIGQDQKPFIVAEMEGNHNQSLKRALEIVDAAAAAGVDAIKIQTFTPNSSMVGSDSNLNELSEPEKLWNEKALFQVAYTPWEWHQPIFDRCKRHGILGFSTPYDASAVDFLELLDVPCYKISSFENTDLPLIRKVAATGKPVIISTGNATLPEIVETVGKAREAGCENIILLKSTSTHPAANQDSNINTLPHMQHLFDCQVGLSDRTVGTGIAIASVAIGASVIEKPVTLSREESGASAVYSLEPDELKNLVIATRNAWEGLGDVHYGPVNGEQAYKKSIRSIFMNQERNAEVADDNARSDAKTRPAFGLAGLYSKKILASAVSRNLKKDTGPQWNSNRPN